MNLGYAFQSLKHVWFSFVFVVISGSPEDRTRHNLVISKAWTTSPRLPCGSHSSRTPESRTQNLLLPKQACFHLHLYPMCVADSVGAYLPCQWAGRRSNPRLRFFRPPLDRLSYQPMLACWVRPVRTRKKARCLRDTEPSCRKQFA